MVGLYNECDEESIVNLVNMGASVIIIAFSAFVVCRFHNNGDVVAAWLWVIASACTCSMSGM